MYAAVTYLRVSDTGDLYSPGETIREEIPAETAAWFLSKGAITKVAPFYDGMREATDEEPDETGEQPVDEIISADEEDDMGVPPMLDVMDDIKPARKGRKAK